MEPLNYSAFEIRLADNPEEIEAAQRLRYQVFYEEMSALPTPEMHARRLDFDGFDRICDHLVVLDREAGSDRKGVVGTYRLLRKSVAARHGGFYSEQEYDLDGILTYPGEIVELGRSCVDPAYRNRGVMQLLWRGLAEYVREHHILLMFGCASFPGTEPEQMGPQLSYLHHFHLAPSWLRPRALAHHYVPMSTIPAGDIDVPQTLNDLPPLIKGYLRVGGFFGDGAVIDKQFNTTDVCVIVKTDQLTQKYDRRYRRSGAETESE